MKKINFEFRGQNKATNVLSFATLDEKIINEVGLKKAVNPCKYLFLGDIVISYETLKREAAAQNKIFLDHLTHMILHSLLHLIGYDHQDENAAKIMESLEVKILQKFAIKNPYN
jgi:probable rRNA maturation factor